MRDAAKCPPDWCEPLLAHISELVIMAHDWEWDTCLSWSEEMFLKMSDGRLKEGWADTEAIKDCQLDAKSRGRMLTASYTRSYARPSTSSAPSAAAGSAVSSCVAGSFYHKDSDARPCHVWNNRPGTDDAPSCGFKADHDTFPERRLHICAYCAYRLKKCNFHKELNCEKKKRETGS